MSTSTSNWSIERVVALLTPVFAGAAGFVTAGAGKLVPGLNFTKTDITALFITGATTALGAALKWLHGRQKFVNFTTDADHVVREVVAHIQALGGAPLVDVEAALQAHEATIIDAIGHKIGVPPTVEDIASQVVKRLIGGGHAAPVA